MFTFSKTKNRPQSGVLLAEILFRYFLINAPLHSDSRQYIKADISNLPDSTEVPIVALYAFTGDEEVIN